MSIFKIREGVKSAFSLGDCYTDNNSNIVQSNFESVWTTGNDKMITIGFGSGYNYNFKIDWGDGNIESFTNEDVYNMDYYIIPNLNNYYKVSHTYNNSGSYNVTISGLVENINITKRLAADGIPINKEVTSLVVNNMGTLGWKNLEKAFYKCNMLETLDTSGLQYSDIYNYKGFLYSCESLTSVNTIGFRNGKYFAYCCNNCISLKEFDFTNLSSAIDITGICQNTIITNVDTTYLTNVLICENAWIACEQLNSFNTKGLTSVTNCSYAWEGCRLLSYFDAIGLISVKKCTGSWGRGQPTPFIFQLDVTFINYLYLVDVVGWAPGSDPGYPSVNIVSPITSTN